MFCGIPVFLQLFLTSGKGGVVLEIVEGGIEGGATLDGGAQIASVGDDFGEVFQFLAIEREVAVFVIETVEVNEVVDGEIETGEREDLSVFEA